MAKKKEEKKVKIVKDSAKINSLIKDLEKEYGEGSAYLLNSAKATKADVIPTGALTVDVASGIGGIARSRITEVVGPESNGKCLTSNMLINTKFGILTVKEIFEKNGLKCSNMEKVSEYHEPLYNMNHKIEETSHFTWNGNRKVMDIFLENGMLLSSTGNHKWFSISKEGLLLWEKSKNLHTGDYLAFKLKSSTYNYKRTEKNEEFYNLGYNFNDKDIPKNIRLEIPSNKYAFIHGILDRYGKIKKFSKYNMFTFKYKHYEVVRKLQAMLHHEGIMCTIEKKITTSKLIIKHEFFVKYINIFNKDKIKFIKNNIMERFVPNMDRILYIIANNIHIKNNKNAKEFNIKNYLKTISTSITYTNLKKFVKRVKSNYSLNGISKLLIIYLENIIKNNYVFIKVKDSNSSNGNRYTFDVVMPKTHSFLVGNCISHNTTLCLSIIAQAQKKGINCAFIDAEHALDPEWCQKIGINLSKLLVSQPDNGEQAINIIEKILESNEFGLIIVDSVTGLVPKAIIEGDATDNFIGIHARLMSQSLKKLTGLVNKSNCALVFTNQLREKIGSYVPMQIPTGGKALKYYASMRLDVRKSGDYEKDGTDIIGMPIKVKFIKNKMAAPFRIATFNIMFDDKSKSYGVDEIECIFNAAVASSIIDKKGSWFAYNNENIGQGKSKCLQLLKHPDNYKLLNEIKELTINSLDGLIEKDVNEEGLK